MICRKAVRILSERRQKKRPLRTCVAYLLADPSTIEREFGVYSLVKDNYRKYVVSMDPIDFSRDGIIHKNIVEFLETSSW
jgi:predicted AAA+ superfamily ATPase